MMDGWMRVVMVGVVGVAMGVCGVGAGAVLPEGVKAEWGVEGAFKETTATRERVCVNGLWRWQPAEGEAVEVPGDGWGYFKVPGAWPGITDYMEKDSQTVYPDAKWKSKNLREVSAAWYQREVTIPKEWAGRRIGLSVDTLNSFAGVYVDGGKVGEIRFPGGGIDLTGVCRPGRTHTLSLHVVAMPLKAVMLSYTDSAHAREIKGTVARRGLCGDVWLVSTPE
jgi:beta-galactosidase